MKRNITLLAAAAAALADTGAGQTNGAGLQDFGGGWDPISPSGKKVESGG